MGAKLTLLGAGRVQGSQVTCELSKEQMYDLFGKLERIQEQLDALA